MGKLEENVDQEFSKIKSVWDAFNYAKEHDPEPWFTPRRRYYTPSTVKEIKEKLKERYSQSVKDINKMNSKQARMVYHEIYKFLYCSKSFIHE
ncbi:MAG: hypothetical protein V1914_00725 [archaeon]